MSMSSARIWMWFFVVTAQKVADDIHDSLFMMILTLISYKLQLRIHSVGITQMLVDITFHDIFAGSIVLLLSTYWWNWYPLTFMVFDWMFIIPTKYDVGGMWSFKWIHIGVCKLLQSWISWPQCVIDRLISIHQLCIYRDKPPLIPKVVTMEVFGSLCYVSSWPGRCRAGGQKWGYLSHIVPKKFNFEEVCRHICELI